MFYHLQHEDPESLSILIKSQQEAKVLQIKKGLDSPNP